MLIAKRLIDGQRIGGYTMEKKFYSDWAVYKGAKYRCKYYSDNIVKLFDDADKLTETPIYTVSKNELEDSFTLRAEAILNEIRYMVYEIENDTVVYRKCLGKAEYTKGNLTDFDMVYFQKIHSEYTEREIVYFDEKKIDIRMANQIFWAEENNIGNLSFGNLEDLIAADELLEMLHKIYGGRIEEDEYNGPWLDIDYLGWVYIEGTR